MYPSIDEFRLRPGESNVARRGTPTPLAPLLAGARARGVADGFEWMGLAAVLIDDRGEVLNVNAGAVELMGDHLFLQGGRLRAHNLAADIALANAIHRALAEGASARVVAPMADGAGAVGIEVAAISAPDDEPFPLLRAVAILRGRGLAAR